MLLKHTASILFIPYTSYRHFQMLVELELKLNVDKTWDCVKVAIAPLMQFIHKWLNSVYNHFPTEAQLQNRILNLNCFLKYWPSNIYEIKLLVVRETVMTHKTLGVFLSFVHCNVQGLFRNVIYIGNKFQLWPTQIIFSILNSLNITIVKHDKCAKYTFQSVSDTIFDQSIIHDSISFK